jgi:hypothetical protein
MSPHNPFHMSRINPINSETASLTIREAFADHVNDYNTPITNMKATLGYSLLAFNVYMQWYPLYEKVKGLTGERAASLYAWSISNASNCLLYAAHFRKIIVDAGENPDKPLLNDYEKYLLEFGSAVAAHKGCIANHVYNNLAQYHNEEEIVILVAFAGQMIASNIFNNVIETEIDNYLIPYLATKFSI